MVDDSRLIIDSNPNLEGIANVNNRLTKLTQSFESVGHVHGDTQQQDRSSQMHDFAQNQTNVLVATTIIETGINVPNATLIVIESAQMFGLAQLHQLRGRVGRSNMQ